MEEATEEVDDDKLECEVESSGKSDHSVLTIFVNVYSNRDLLLKPYTADVEMMSSIIKDKILILSADKLQ